jgi:hypothetical protein
MDTKAGQQISETACESSPARESEASVADLVPRHERGVVITLALACLWH